MMKDRKADRSPTLTAREEFELRQFREAGVSVSECAQYFGISKAMTVRVLDKLRLTFGPEKLRRMQRVRAPSHSCEGSAPIPELAQWLKTSSLVSKAGKE